MTPTVDIAELRAELDTVSSGIAYSINREIVALTIAQRDALLPDEKHPGTVSLSHTFRSIGCVLEVLEAKADQMQALRRRILNAEDARHQQVAS